MLLSRRRVLFGGMTLAAAGALVGCGDESALAAPAPTLEERIRELEARHNAFIGLYAANLQSGLVVDNRADEPFALCSTFKTYAAARVLRGVADGEFSLDQPIFVPPEGVLPNSPVTGERLGQQMTLAELSQAALQRSDNLAANLLLEAIGGSHSWPGCDLHRLYVGGQEEALRRPDGAQRSARCRTRRVSLPSRGVAIAEGGLLGVAD